MSKNIAATAEAAGKVYISALPFATNDSKQFAFEDFVAGYMSGALECSSGFPNIISDATMDKSKPDMSFIIRQLEDLINIAQREGEFYSLSIARYTLERLKKS